MILVAGGMVITAVGLGDKGFKSVELRLLGPVIVLTGLTLIFIRLNIKHFICGVENSVRELLKRWRMVFWLQYPTSLPSTFRSSLCFDIMPFQFYKICISEFFFAASHPVSVLANYLVPVLTAQELRQCPVWENFTQGADL